MTFVGGQGIKWLALDKVWSGYVIGLFFVFGLHRSLVVYSHAQSSYPLAASALGASSSSSHSSFTTPPSPFSTNSRIKDSDLFYFILFTMLLFVYSIFCYSYLVLYFVSVCAEGNKRSRKIPLAPANKKTSSPKLRL